MALEFGLSNVFFVNEGMTPEKLSRLSNGSVQAVEILWHYQHADLTPSVVKETFRILSDIGIRCHSFHAPFGVQCNSAAVTTKEKQSTTEAYCRSLDYLDVLQGQMLVVHPSFGTIDENEHEERLKHAVESLVWLSGECDKAGIYLAVENLHSLQLGNTADELDRIIENMSKDRVGVCLDFAHAHVAGGASQVISRLKSQIIALHLCDNTKPDVETTCWPLQPEGLIDWNEVLRELKNKHYEGVMMYETYNHLRPDPDRDGLSQLEENYRDLIHIFQTC